MPLPALLRLFLLRAVAATGRLHLPPDLLVQLLLLRILLLQPFVLLLLLLLLQLRLLLLLQVILQFVLRE